MLHFGLRLFFLGGTITSLYLGFSSPRWLKIFGIILALILIAGVITAALGIV
jgi:hypothetical protein